MGTVAQHQMASHWDLMSVQMVLQYHLQLLSLPTGSSLVQEYLPMVTVGLRQMVYLLDQMSVPMDLLYHLHLQWQPPPVQLLWLQMVSLWALVSLQMGTVAQHQMASRLDQMSVPMELQYHLHLQWQPPQVQLLWLLMVSLWALVSLRMGTVAQHQMASHWDLMSVQMVLQYHLPLLSLPTGSSLGQEYLPMVTVGQRQMVYLLDQMSVPMVLQYHLQLLSLPTGLSWVQEYLPMVTVEQRQMVYLLDQMSVPMDLL